MLIRGSESEDIRMEAEIEVEKKKKRCYAASFEVEEKDHKPNAGSL